MQVFLTYLRQDKERKKKTFKLKKNSFKEV